ncbi:MAG: hypothetical protein RDV48_05290 [Candidatus Eremiobacteraeota bacterium]|nr:hypothetical protein [Candidatus Eremiobacteraeota bacterium]
MSSKSVKKSKSKPKAEESEALSALAAMARRDGEALEETLKGEALVNDMTAREIEKKNRINIGEILSRHES